MKSVIRRMIDKLMSDFFVGDAAGVSSLLIVSVIVVLNQIMDLP
jgi:hypothetical protein